MGRALPLPGRLRGLWRSATSPATPGPAPALVLERMSDALPSPEHVMPGSLNSPHTATARVLTAVLTGLRAEERTGSDSAGGAAFVAEYAPEFATAATTGPVAVAEVATTLAAETGGALMCVVKLAADRLGEQPADLLIDLIRLYRQAARTT